MEQHGRADADAIAVHRRNQRNFAAGKRSKQSPHRNLVIKARSSIEKIRKIVPRGKILALAAQGDQADALVLRRALDRVGKCRIHCDGDRIAAFRPGEGDRKHFTLLCHPHMFAHWPGLPRIG